MSAATASPELTGQRRDQAHDNNNPSNSEAANKEESQQKEKKSRDANALKVPQQKMNENMKDCAYPNPPTLRNYQKQGELMQLEKQIDLMIDEEIEGDKYTEEMVN